MCKKDKIYYLWPNFCFIDFLYSWNHLYFTWIRICISFNARNRYLFALKAIPCLVKNISFQINSRRAITMLNTIPWILQSLIIQSAFQKYKRYKSFSEKPDKTLSMSISLLFIHVKVSTFSIGQLIVTVLTANTKTCNSITDMTFTYQKRRKNITKEYKSSLYLTLKSSKWVGL